MKKSKVKEMVFVFSISISISVLFSALTFYVVENYIITGKIDEKSHSILFLPD